MTIKISAFPNAATNMGSGDTVTGLQGGANVNFSQSQIGVAVNRIVLTSAQLLHLHSSPAVLIPAPGAGKIIYPLGISFSYEFGTTPYVSSDNAEAVTYANGVAGNIDLFTSMGAMATAFTGSVSAGPIIGIFDSTGGLPIVYTASVNQALVLGEPVADATGGDGTVTFTIIYAIVSAP